MSSIGTPPVFATGVLTNDGTVPTAADTVTIGGQVYTYRAAVGTTANEVKIGAAGGVESIANLILAVNAGPTGSGTLFGSLTVANPDVRASAGSTTSKALLTARVPGTVGNFIPCSESGSHTAMAGSVLGTGTGATAGVGGLDTVIALLRSEFQLPADLCQALIELTPSGATG